MSKLSKTTSALLLACCASALIGCGTNASQNGTKLTYRIDQSSPDVADASNPTTTQQPVVTEDPAIDQLAAIYDETHAKRVAAPTAPARQAQPAAPKAEPTLAAKEDIEKAKARVSELRGTVKTAKNGAITALSIESADATLDDMKLFGRLYDLESVSFLGSNFTDEFLAEFKDLKKVTSFTVQNAEITGETLKMFAQYPELKSLDIRRDLQLANKDLAVVAEMPKLEKLGAYYNKFSSIGVKRIATSPTLKIVDLRGSSGIDDAACRYLITMPALQEVYFRFQISNEGVKTLAEAPKLEFVEFQDCEIDNDCSQYFVNYPALKALRVFRSKRFEDGGVAGLAPLKLERLELRDLNVSNAGVLPLKDMASLRVVELSELNNVDAEALKTVCSSWKDLTSLYLFSMSTNDDVVATIAESMPNLTSLTLRASVGELSDASIDSILKLQNLETLDLRENAGLTLEGLKKLSALPKLKKFYIKGTALGATSQEARNAIDEFKKANPRCSFSN